MVQHLLIAHDGSDVARRAFTFATQLARLTGADLSVLSVVSTLGISADYETGDPVERSRGKFEQLHVALQREQAASGLALRTIIALGEPAEQVLRYAADHPIDHIVIGHPNKSALQRWLEFAVRQVLICGRIANCRLGSAVDIGSTCAGRREYEVVASRRDAVIADIGSSVSEPAVSDR